MTTSGRGIAVEGKTVYTGQYSANTNWKCFPLRRKPSEEIRSHFSNEERLKMLFGTWMTLSMPPPSPSKMLRRHALYWSAIPHSAWDLCENGGLDLTCPHVPRAKHRAWHTVWCPISAHGWRHQGVTDLNKDCWADNPDYSSVQQASIPSLIVASQRLASRLYSWTCTPATIWTFIGLKWMFVLNPLLLLYFQSCKNTFR